MLRTVGIVHYSDENVTWLGVSVPEIVPVILDLDENDVIGRAKLTEIPADPETGLNFAVRAEIEFYEEMFNLPDPPIMQCGLVGSTPRTYDKLTKAAYVSGGYVGNVSVLSARGEQEVFDQDADEGLLI